MGTDFSCRVIRSFRKTIAIQIMPGGEILVRCPQNMPEKEIRIFVESKRGWIEKHLAKQAAYALAPVLTQTELKELTEKARKGIPERVTHFANLMGVTYGRITIRTQRSRWGSCGGSGNLNFNCLLMLVPPEILDYVVVHELCHRKEMNHSPHFWAEVARILPDYKAGRKWLKENGTALIGRLP